MPNIQIVRELPEGPWRDFVASHPQGNIFHTPEMFQVFQRTRFYEPELWAATCGGRIQALIVPVRIVQWANPIVRRLTMRSIVHGSVLAVEGHEGREALSFLLSDYIRRSRGQTAFTELRNMADLQALQPVLTQQGFAFEEHLNYLIDLDRSQDEIFGGIGARTRKNIKRAQKKDLVKIETVCEDRALDECYAILERTYRKASVPFADHSLFKAALDVLLPKNMIRISLARVNGEPAATSLDLLYKDTIFGWYGGVDRGHRMFVPNEVLTWEILKWGSANGYRVYDFGGAGQPDQKYGVRDFKAKFGGRLVAFGRNRCIHWPIRYRSISFLYGHLRPLVFR